MSALVDILGGLAMLAGTTFLLLGSLGLMRMPDVFNRIQAGTKATTLGTLLVLAGAALMHPEWTLKLLLIAFFLLMTNPLSSQVLANAAHRSGADRAGSTHVDHLAEDRERGS